METITKNNIKKYSTYKNSGVEWLGEIPEHWEVIKLKYLSEIKTGYTPITSDSSNFSKNGTIWAKPDNLNDFNLIKNSKEKVSSKGIKSQNIIPKNSILVCCIGTIGKFGIAGVDLITNQQINSIIFNTKISNKYGKYLIANCKSEFNKWANGNVVSILNTSAQKNIYFLLPPLSEQTKIAKFLDDKTKKIDEAIAIKTQQINLLKERKQILIHKAVTRGLDTNVKLKNSGVEWIGEIPVHWDLSNFRYLINVLTDYTANGSFGDLAKYVTYLNEPSFSRLIRLTDLRKNLEKSGVYLDKKSHTYLSKSELFGGELLIANVGAYAGLAWIMPEIDSPASLAPNMFLIKPYQNKIQIQFLYYLINSNSYSKYISIVAQSAAQPKLNKDNIRQLKIILPPLSEQKEISSYIEKSSEKITTAIGLKSEEISTLKEYKSSLINSVVTGKVRVC